MTKRHLLAVSLALNIVFVPTGAIYLIRKAQFLSAVWSTNEAAPEPAVDLPTEFISTLDYQWPRQLFEQESVAPGAVVFLGDSLTAGGHWEDVWQGKVPFQILNRGLGGDRMEGILARLDEITRHRPSKLFVMVGVNDLRFEKKPPEVLEHQFRDLIERVRIDSPDTLIYLQSILPVREGQLNREVLSTNQRLVSLDDGRRVKYVDLNALMSDESGQLRQDLTYDGQHLRAAGYREWRDAVWPVVKR